MAGTGQFGSSGGERIWLASGPGSDEDWRRPVANELHKRGSLARNFQEASTLVVVVGQNFTLQGGSQRQSNEMSGLQDAISQALKSNMLIIPLLVDAASLPKPNDLPSAIQDFHLQNALVLESQAALPGVVTRIIAESRLSNSRIEPTIRSGTPPDRSIFISYRRDDTSHWAQMLARALALSLGSENVYLDVGSGRAGGDFRHHIETRVKNSSDVVVLIGPGFLATDRSGRPRIGKSDDYVRWEVSMALRQNKQLHVVLVAGGIMPDRSQLPLEIVKLAEIELVYDLPSGKQVGQVANEIIRARRITGSLQGLGLPLKSVGFGMRAGQGYETRSVSIVRALSEHGWYLSEQSGRNTDAILANGQFPDYRFRIQTDLAEIFLEEKSGLGLSRWLQRATFSISPHTLDDLAVFQLSDRLLEAALDPHQYLNRVGRINLGRGKQPPMRSDRLAKTLRDYSEKNEPAMEAHLELKRRLAASRQPARMKFEGNLQLPVKTRARAVACHPHGHLLAVGTENGIFLYHAVDWSYAKLEKGGWFRSIAISQGGLTAAANDDGKLSIWDEKGRWLAKKISPYSFFKRVSSEPRFKVAGWSPSGNVVACCDEEAVWLYLLDKKEFFEWKFPVQQPLNWENGLSFTPDGRQIVVHGHDRHLWLVDLGSWQVQASLELAMHSVDTAYTRTVKSKRSGVDIAFHSIFQLAISPRGDYFVCSGSSGQIMLFSLPDLNPGQRLVGHEIAVNGLPINVQLVSFDPSGRFLASQANDRRLIIWDTNAWLPVAEGRVGWSPIISRGVVSAWLGNSRRLVSIGEEGELGVWRF